jgi:8-oxo-dGTP diphosphatase
MPFTYEFPRPGVTADTVLFTLRADDLAVLLIQRRHAPYKGAWALPGGFVDQDEALDHAATRELEEETGIKGVALEQLGAFGEPGRDPRGHTITVAFLSFVVADTPPVAADDAADAAWHSLRTLPLTPWGEKPAKPAKGEKGEKQGEKQARRGLKLAFDHALIIEVARRRLQEHLVDPARTAPFEIVPARFTLKELHRVYEAILGRPLPSRSFRAGLVDRGVVEPVARARRGPAQLYRFKPARRG